jgi:pyruvate dehydrogenase E1 component beta subunit
MPDVPEPTSYGLTKGFYIRAKDIAKECLSLMHETDKDLEKNLPEYSPHDIPGNWFKGPF